jgi:hypothetical protein
LDSLDFQSAVVRQVVVLVMSGVLTPEVDPSLGMLTGWSMNAEVQDEVENLLADIKHETNRALIEGLRPDDYVGDNDGETPGAVLEIRTDPDDHKSPGSRGPKW